MIALLMYGLGFLMSFIVLAIAIKMKNIFAVCLLVPYLLFFAFGSFKDFDELQNQGQKVIFLGDMQKLNKIEMGDVISIVYSSDIVFGDGKCAGGLIRSPEEHPAIRELLASANQMIGNESSLIWLKDSKASKILVGPQLMYFPDQTRAESGIWITLIPKNAVKHVKNMDGSNLP